MVYIQLKLILDAPREIIILIFPIQRSFKLYPVKNVKNKNVKNGKNNLNKRNFLELKKIRKNNKNYLKKPKERWKIKEEIIKAGIITNIPPHTARVVVI